jgi:PAS domain S-box-containing protein
MTATPHEPASPDIPAAGNHVRVRSKYWLVAAIVTATLVPVAIWGWVAFETRVNTLAVALADERRVTEALGEHTLKLLEAQAFALDLVDNAAGERDCPALGADAWTQDLMHLAAQSSQTKALWLINADGFLCMASDPARMDTRNRSFREYFTGAREAPPGRRYVDRAIVGLAAGSVPAFTVAKARRKNGAFNGIVLASVSLTELVQYWQKVIDTLPTQRIGLFREDGATIARSWLPLVPTPDPATEQRLAATWRTLPDGSGVHPSAIDGLPRISAWHSLPDWGVVVTSSIDQEAVLAPWRRSMLIDGVVAMVMSGLLAMLTWSLLRAGRILTTLRESEARFRAAVQAVTGILWTNNAEGKMAGEQPGWTALTGQTREQYQGYGWTEAVHPEDVQPTVDAWNAAVAERRRFVFEHRLRRHDGIWRRFAIRAIPLSAEDGTLREWVGVHTDITEQRAAEVELADLNRMLEERVRTEVTAREDAQTRAVHAQRMQALGQLAGGIAHDFNNILQAVQGGAGLIERRATDAASVRRFARTVTEAAERGAAVTRRLLAFARRGDLRAERIDPTGLLDGLRDVLAQTLGSPITVRLEGTSGLPAVMADRGQLETVLVNLATNGRDAMPDGGTLTLGAETEKVAAGRVHSAALKPGRYIRLSVTDTGTGMDRTTLERALEPFFTTKPQDKGTGLGLSMAKGFAEQSGGALAIQSAPGRGTTVTLWLPVADARKQMAQLQPGLAPVAGLARRVLLVDDEDVVREVLVASLDDAGFAVLAAANGAEALALLDAGEPVDVLVSDLSMPGMGGLALIREAQVRRPGLPSVLLTGYAGEAAHLAVSGPPPGSFSLLRKPVSVARLVDRIEMVLAANTGAAQ